MDEAYSVFWDGCQFAFGSYVISYRAFERVSVRSFNKDISKALFGQMSYFELPHMYTTSLFHKEIIENARQLQDGKLLIAHPQDANLAVIAASLEKEYLKSDIPLGWNGASQKSAGMAMSFYSNNNIPNSLTKLKNEYQKTIDESKIKYHFRAGNFSFSNCSIYLWQAFLKTPTLRTDRENKKFVFPLFLVFFFAAIGHHLRKKRTNIEPKLAEYEIILSRNRCNRSIVGVVSIFIGFIIEINNSIRRVLNRIVLLYYKINGKLVEIIVHWDDSTRCFTIADASLIVMDGKNKKFVQKWINSLKNDIG